MNSNLKGTVYIIDDDEMHRHSLKRFLTMHSYITHEFNSVDNFLSIVNFSHPCVIILDMRMPEKSGLDLQTHLAHAQINIPIIYLSGQSFPEEIIASFKKGAFDFMLKPFDCDALLSSVSNAIAIDKENIINSKNEKDLFAAYNALTDREKEVYKLINEGFMSVEIAEKLDITPRTIKAHKSKIMEKMGANSPQDLLKKWLAIKNKI